MFFSKFQTNFILVVVASLYIDSKFNIKPKVKMVELQTPPPSYEVATGISGAQQNQFFRDAPPPKPPVADEIRPTPYNCNNTILTTTLTTSRVTQHLPRYRPIYNVSRTHSSSNRLKSNSLAACYIITIICVTCFVLVCALVARSGFTNQTSYNDNSYHKIEPGVNFDFDGWEKKQDELEKMLDDLGKH